MIQTMTEPVPPASTAGSGTSSELAVPGAAPVRYSVPEAARALGISERAVRKRIDAGSLAAEKDGRAWSVLLPTVVGTARPAVPAAPVTIVAEPGGGTDQEPAAPAVPDAVPPGLDLTPLADLIATQQAEIQRLTEAATTWQLRARHLEERLLALGAGDPATVPTPPTPSPAPSPATTTPDPPRPWWRRLIGGAG